MSGSRGESALCSRNRGIPVDEMAAKANASVSVIGKHYDNPDYIEEMEKRCCPFLDRLDFDESRGDLG